MKGDTGMRAGRVWMWLVPEDANVPTSNPGKTKTIPETPDSSHYLNSDMATRIEIRRVNYLHEKVSHIGLVKIIE